MMQVTPLNHATVLLHEAIDALAIKPDGIYVDGTFGRGGHSRLILERLGASGRLIAFDKDPDALAVAESWQDGRFQIVHAGFAQLALVLEELGVEKVDGVLLDIGVSSPQLDDATRGFSFRFDAPLDMRMDTSSGLTAAEWLAQADESELANVIYQFGEERFSRKIARAIVEQRQLTPIETTLQLSNLVGRVVRTREPGKNPATRTFQAIRIFINQELVELEQVLPAAVSVLKLAGRLVVISFHSLEDRIVKNFMRDQAKGEVVPYFLPVRDADLAAGKLRLASKAIRASSGEVAGNSRARSAVLRVAERTDAD